MKYLNYVVLVLWNKCKNAALRHPTYIFWTEAAVNESSPIQLYLELVKSELFSALQTKLFCMFDGLSEAILGIYEGSLIWMRLDRIEYVPKKHGHSWQHSYNLSEDEVSKTRLYWNSTVSLPIRFLQKLIHRFYGTLERMSFTCIYNICLDICLYI